MNTGRWGWLLLCACAAAFLWSGRPSGAMELAVPLCVWALAAFSADALRLPRGAGAWTAWVGWGGACLWLSKEPLIGLSAWWIEATAVAAMICAYTWWRAPHWRAWIAGLWIAAAAAAGCAFLRWRLEFVAPILGAASASGVWMFAGDFSNGNGRLGSASGALALGAALAVFGYWEALFGVLISAAACLWWRGTGAPRRLMAAICGLAALATLHLYAAAHPGFGEWLRAAWAAAGRSPIVGIGPGQARRLLSEMRSVPLQMVLETGWIGLGLYAWALWLSFPRDLESYGKLGLAAAGVYCALLAQSLIDPSLRSPALQLLMFAALAGALGTKDKKEEASGAAALREWRKPRWAFGIGMAACIGAWAPRAAARQGERMARSPTPEIRRAGLERILSVAPEDADARFRLAIEFATARPVRIGAALDHLDRAIETDSGNALYPWHRAQLFAAYADWPRAAASAEQALTLEARFLDARLILAESYLGSGDRAQARAELSRVLELSANLPRPREAAQSRMFSLDQEHYDRVKRAVERADAR